MDRNKKTKKKIEKEDERGDRSRARPRREVPQSRGPVFIRRLLSFPFESLLIFFCTTRVPFDSNASRLARAILQFFVARGIPTPTPTPQDTREHARTFRRWKVVWKVVGKSRGSARRTKRKSGNRSRVREEETEIQTKKVHAYALEETRNRREKSTPERLGRGQRTRRTVAKTHIEQHKHTQAQRHARREREGQTTHREK